MILLSQSKACYQRVISSPSSGGLFILHHLAIFEEIYSIGKTVSARYPFDQKVLMERKYNDKKTREQEEK